MDPIPSNIVFARERKREREKKKQGVYEEDAMLRFSGAI